MGEIDVIGNVPKYAHRSVLPRGRAIAVGVSRGQAITGAGREKVKKVAASPTPSPNCDFWQQDR